MFKLLTKDTLSATIEIGPTASGHNRRLWGNNWHTYWLTGDFCGAVLEDISFRQVSLHGIDLRGARLRGASFEHVEMRDLSLRDTDLRGARFDMAFLSDCDLTNADLREVTFKQSYLSNIDATGSRLDGLTIDASYMRGANRLAHGGARLRDTFVHPNSSDITRERLIASIANLPEAAASRRWISGIDLRGVDLEEANLESATFIRCDFRGVVLRKARLGGTHFLSCDLRGCDFSHATLQNAHLDRCDLRGANLADVDADHAKFGNASNASEASFARANLTNVSFAADFDSQTNANLNHTDFQGADLTNATFQIVNLGAARFDGATLDRTAVSGDLPFAGLAGLDLRRMNFRDISSLFRANLAYVNLADADLHEIGFIKAKPEQVLLANANLRGANLAGIDLSHSRLTGADLQSANLSKSILQHVDLSAAVLRQANLASVDLTAANLARADLTGADLTGAHLVGVNLEEALLVDCSIYGASVWNSRTSSGTKQVNLRITLPNEPAITVDSLEVAQFVYLLVNNNNIRRIVDTITKKVVLILGRFTEDRKRVLDAIREQLRRDDFVPILFDFEKPASRDLTETISTLAHISRFVIADITDAKSIPQELQRIVPDLPSVPVQPLLEMSEMEYGMFEHFQRYPWVLAVHRYRDLADLMATVTDKVIAPAEAKAKELQAK